MLKTTLLVAAARQGARVPSFLFDGNKDGGTAVTWAMEGPVPYIAKIAHLVMTIDKMIGTDFEVGVTSLKALAEAR